MDISSPELLSLKIYFVCFLAVVVTVGGDYFVAEAARRPDGSISLLIVGAALYAVTAIGWLFLFQNTSIATAAILYAAMTTILLIALARFVFGEVISTKTAIAGCLAVAAIFLTEV